MQIKMLGIAVQLNFCPGGSFTGNGTFTVEKDRKIFNYNLLRNFGNINALADTGGIVGQLSAVENVSGKNRNGGKQTDGKQTTPIQFHKSPDAAVSISGKSNGYGRF